MFTVGFFQTTCWPPGSTKIVIGREHNKKRELVEERTSATPIEQAANRVSMAIGPGVLQLLDVTLRAERVTERRGSGSTRTSNLYHFEKTWICQLGVFGFFFRFFTGCLATPNSTRSAMFGQITRLEVRCLHQKPSEKPKKNLKRRHATVKPQLRLFIQKQTISPSWDPKTKPKKKTTQNRPPISVWPRRANETRPFYCP